MSSKRNSSILLAHLSSAESSISWNMWRSPGNLSSNQLQNDQGLIAKLRATKAHGVVMTEKQALSKSMEYTKGEKIMYKVQLSVVVFSS